MTVLWSVKLPQNFKDFCAKVSIDTSSIQYENDDLMRGYWGDDYSIACCVSAMKTGKQMQFFGARCNLAKTLLYAINGGRDELTGKQITPAFEPIKDDYLNYDDVMARFNTIMDWIAQVYIKALNIIHYMHDKYNYEKLEMALHDKDILRTMACGIAGLSVVADSLSAIKFARVKGLKNVFTETCPQYLFLDESLYKQKDGLKYIMSPPLRDKSNQKTLWDGIITGEINTVGTDHCPFFYNKEKQLGKADFTKAPGGIPGVEARIPLLYSKAVEGKLDMGKFISLCCAEPARLFGMYPKKGAIATGSDADLVIIDPTIKQTLTHELLHENCDYTPYEGTPLKGYAIMTISRGEIIVENGNFISQKGRGRFIKRNLPELI